MSTPRYVKPAEPNWTDGEQLLFAAEIMRTARMQVGTLQNKRGLSAVLTQRLNTIAKKLEYCEKECMAANSKPGSASSAEYYLDNQGSLWWECLNEMRKLPDQRAALLVLHAANAGMVVEHATGMAVNQITFENPSDDVEPAVLDS